ncbi:hypothetical protein O7626_13345 [Micromonospora sp. WMMD1102]|uniref:hypothetical protein n=1 Tax=Micromonospora sp. WMMD1102 TaxID=3016105 RepID=UPI0024157F9D|nr:hypothetical protein [Micromonospora sp. WMMD1102]MDG4786904.1 hypothetical protein [Micromonospora sp. WMMD1102]
MSGPVRPLRTEEAGSGQPPQQATGPAPVRSADEFGVRRVDAGRLAEHPADIDGKPPEHLAGQVRHGLGTCGGESHRPGLPVTEVPQRPGEQVHQHRPAGGVPVHHPGQHRIRQVVAVPQQHGHVRAGQGEVHRPEQAQVATAEPTGDQSRRGRAAGDHHQPDPVG